MTRPVRQGSVLNFHSPAVIGVIVVSVIALVALGFIFGPRFGPGPIASGEPSPSPTTATTATAEPSPSAAVPSPTAVPTATPVPTPAPAAAWTGLVWSDPVTPSFTVHLYDIVPWGGRYVAVGVAEAPGQGPASFTSPDGLNWTIGQADFPGVPKHLVRRGDELLAFLPEFNPNPPGPGIVGAPPATEIWRSADGVAWTPVDSMTWSEAWYQAVIDGVVRPYPDGWDPAQFDLPLGVVDVANGPDGLVAIGNSFGDGALSPIILHSTDGKTWTPAELPVDSNSALLNTVVEHDGRFVITGATGVWTDPATATAAAWYSDDGLAWIRATIEPNDLGVNVRGAEFGPLWASESGLVTCRGNREMSAGGWRYMQGWLSADGTSWRYSPQPGPHPACDWSASDGNRIVSLGPRDHASPMPWPGVTTASWSIDGVEWQSLDLSSVLTDRLERFWVVPDGVIYAGEQSFWFGIATTE
jgi:hypothetical protein